MVEVIKEEPEDTAPAAAPSQLPAQSDVWSETDALLSEYDSVVGKQAEPEPEELPASENGVANDELDKLLADLSAPSADQQRADGLQSELNDLRNQMRAAEDLKAFNEFSDDLTKQVAAIAPHVQDDWVRLKLESYAHDPVARLAWETRNIDPRAAALDLAHVQHALAQLQANPNADPAKVQELNRLAYQLNIAANSPAILRQVRNQIMSEAKKKPPPIDEQVTADVAGVAQYIRDGQGPINIPEPPVRWGNLSAREGREKVKTDFGFDPGWGW
jgi:hypothetical protein